MDFRTLSEEELRTFLRAGTACFDNKKLAEQEALKRYVRFSPYSTEEYERGHSAGYTSGEQDGYAEGLEAGRAEFGG